MKIVKSFEDSGLLLKGANKTIKNKKTNIELLRYFNFEPSFIIWFYGLVG